MKFFSKDNSSQPPNSDSLRAADPAASQPYPSDPFATPVSPHSHSAQQSAQTPASTHSFGEPSSAYSAPAFTAQPRQSHTVNPVVIPQPESKKKLSFLSGVAIVAAIGASGLLGGVIGAGLDNSMQSSTQVLSIPEPVAKKASQAPAGTAMKVAEDVLPSLVSIEIRTRTGKGDGSGIVLSTDGLILTNAHVISVADRGGDIRVFFRDGTEATATVVGQDPTTDIAVIRVKTTKDLQPIRFGTAKDLVVGQPVVAIGSPLGLAGTVTEGIVSALNRPVRAGGSDSDQSTVIDAIQTDAAINPGNSGGALVNMAGELVGVNSAIASLGAGSESGSIGLGFAIPVDQARRVALELVNDGKATMAVLGVSVGTPRDQRGAAVEDVVPGGAADTAGIPPGSVVKKVNDRLIDSADALVAAIRSLPAGETISLHYIDPLGDEQTTTATVQANG